MAEVLCDECLQWHGHEPGCSNAPAPRRRASPPAPTAPAQKRAREADQLARLLMQEPGILERFAKLPPEMRVNILRNIDRSLYDLRKLFDPTFPAPAATAELERGERAWYEEQWSTACDES